MRTIKFRAWLKSKNRFIDTFSVDFYDEKALGIIYVDRNKIMLVPYGQFVLEQDTGLKDKNGESIWEGDILMDDTGEPIEYWVVKLSDGGFVGECIGVIENLFELEHLEIVGNIHKNPELLEVDKR